MNNFKEQLQKGVPISEEVLPKFSGKYYSGREYKAGEIVLYGLLEKDETTCELITLHEDEINDFEIVLEKCMKDNFIPYIKRK